jgi:hypothetical protein
MKKPNSSLKQREEDDFEAASHQPSESLVREFWQFIKENKTWWMIPIVVCLGLLSIVIVMASTGAAPFIYTLF